MGLNAAIDALLAQDTARDPVRAAHAEAFRAAGLPDTRQENWKYTSLKPLEKLEFSAAWDEAPALAAEDLAELGLACPGGWRVVFVNGRYQAALSQLDELPDGVVLGALSSLDGSDWMGEKQARAFEAPDEALAALNGAAAHDGLVLDLAEGVELERPIEVLHLGLSHELPGLFNQRHLVRLAPGARARLVEQYRGLGEGAYFGNDVLQAELQRGAALGHVRLQRAGAGALVTRAIVDQAADSRYEYFGFDLGGRLVRHDLQLALCGEGAECRLNGIYLLGDGEHVDNHIRVDHRSPRAASHERFKGVLGGRSRGVFNGKVVVHEGADGTEATQTNGNLLLSRRAEIDTKPELEIYADDVTCSHGATVGQLDPDQLFYLRSRGLAEGEARDLLTEAFCREIVDAVEDESLREFIGARVNEHRPGSDLEENP